ncbi:MAG: tRNA pseudouridine(55) synthase TruB [Clostridiales bacterium]|nr:tRNA pseudouridine(55) synthase TruB [Clostridiales bacterium]
MNGFINVLKPVGATASDVVVCIKHVLHEKKVGHLGTLDPGASGVLPVAVGQGTKLFNFLTNKVKFYRAFFTFGKTTDTLDSYGEVIESDGTVPTTEQLTEALKGFAGEIQQVPPAYSAISVGGVRAYKLARNGQTLELCSRAVQIYDISFVEQRSADTFVVDIKCSGGTYIRSLARDIANACGTVGYMSGLIRLQSGCFDIESAYTLDEIRELKEQCLVDIMYPIKDVEDYVVEDKLFDDLNNGRSVHAEFDGYRKIYCKGVFFGLGKSVNGRLDLEYYLKNAI